VVETVIRLEAVGLSALAGAGRSEKDESSYFRNPSYWRIISCASI